jgi:hypothetical protein
MEALEQGPDSVLISVTIPAEVMPLITARVTKLAKRCARLSMPVPVLVEVGRAVVERPPEIGAPAWLGKTMVEKVDLELHVSESISLGGWSLLGRVDALPDGTPIVARAPGTETRSLPLIAATDTCDHCGKRRRRTETFVVAHEDGRTAQVGRNCLRDFLGHDPARLLAWYRYVDEELDEFEGFASSAARERLFLTAEVLDLASRVVAHGGFLSKSKAREINMTIAESDGTTGRKRAESSADKVLWRIDPPRPSNESQRRQLASEVEAWDERYPTDVVSEELQRLTTEAVASIDPSSANEWEANIAAIFGQTHIKPLHVGIAVSALLLGLRGQERVERVAKAPESHHLGAIGDRLDLRARIVFIRGFDGDYGTRTLLKFESPGAAMLWWASGIPHDPTTGDYRPWAAGDEVDLRGTVKAHSLDAFDGRAITELTRCRLAPIPLSQSTAEANGNKSDE